MFHDDPMVNRHFSEIGLSVCGKREDFGKRRRENIFERKRERTNVSINVNSDLLRLYS